MISILLALMIFVGERAIAAETYTNIQNIQQMRSNLNELTSLIAQTEPSTATKMNTAKKEYEDLFKTLVTNYRQPYGRNWQVTAAYINRLNFIHNTTAVYFLPASAGMDLSLRSAVSFIPEKTILFDVDAWAKANFKEKILLMLTEMGNFMTGEIDEEQRYEYAAEMLQEFYEKDVLMPIHFELGPNWKFSSQVPVDMPTLQSSFARFQGTLDFAIGTEDSGQIDRNYNYLTSKNASSAGNGAFLADKVLMLSVSNPKQNQSYLFLSSWLSPIYRMRQCAQWTRPIEDSDGLSYFNADRAQYCQNKLWNSLEQPTQDLVVSTRSGMIVDCK